MAVIVANMDDQVLHLRNDIEVEFRVDLWPSERFAIEAIKLGPGTINRSLLEACLDVDLVRIVILRQESLLFVKKRHGGLCH